MIQNMSAIFDDKLGAVKVQGIVVDQEDRKVLDVLIDQALRFRDIVTNGVGDGSPHAGIGEKVRIGNSKKVWILDAVADKDGKTRARLEDADTHAKRTVDFERLRPVASG